MNNNDQSPGDKVAGVLFKTTLVDYPGKVACAIFLQGCNLRCPYCYNIDIVNSSLQKEEGATFDEIIAHLNKRKNVLSGFVISGGEALLSPFLEPLIRNARSLGYLIKLDTNGTADDKLEKLINDKSLCPDFIALDIKTSPDNYFKLVPQLTNENQKQNLTNSILHSIKLISELPPSIREFRTVLVPPLVTLDDIDNIASLLPADASWQFAQFRNENCIDKNYCNISPYIDSQIEQLIQHASLKIKGAKLR